MSGLHHHLKESLKLENVPTPWPRMILCALCVTLPLIVGYARGELRMAIYGALLGFVMILNDHFGPYLRRVVHLCTTFVFLLFAFYLGALLVNSPVLALITVFALAFLVGKSKGLGLELERMLLFTTLQFLAGYESVELHSKLMLPFFYSVFAFANYLVCLSIVFLIMKHTPNFQQSKRKEFFNAIRKKDSQRYALTLAMMTCLGVYLSRYFQVEKGYWVVGTIMIVMMPDRNMSYQRSFQRLFGTLIGVVAAAFLIRFGKDPRILIGFSALASFMAPSGLLRNYWLGNVFIASLIMFFLELATGGQIKDQHLAILRIIDIGLGCVLGVVGTFIAWPGLRQK